MDNGASHRNWAAADRLSSAYPNAQMAHLPVHASWLNQVEVYFSVIQRKLLTPDDFEGLDELAAQILSFEEHYNTAARPFDWRFTRTDLNQILTRIRSHNRHAPHPQAATASRAHARLRAPRERANAQLKTWHILRSCAAAPGRPGRSLKPSTYFRHARSEDEKASVSVFHPAILR